MNEENVVEDASSLEEAEGVIEESVEESGKDTAKDELDISDAALDQAADNTVSEEVEEEVEEEVVEEEPQDNAERTKLGRRVSAQEKIINDLNTKLDLLLEHQVGSGEGKEEVEDTDYSDDDPLTARELKAMLPDLMQEVATNKNSKKNKYEEGFLASMAEQGKDLDEDTYKNITDIFVEKYNSGANITGNPEIDAQLAFVKAERDYAQMNMGGGKKTLRSKKAPSVDKPGAQGVKPKDIKAIKLDKDAQHLVDKMGISPEEIQEALGR